MKAWDTLTTGAIAIEQYKRLENMAGDLVARQNINLVPVVNNKKPAGIFSDHNIMKQRLVKL